jgi:hypothetical protein
MVDEGLMSQFNLDVKDKLKFFNSKKEHESDYYRNYFMIN